MQQVWSKPGILEKFLTQEECEALRPCFAGQYSLDQADAPEEIIRRVKAEPEKFVIKPQREGGGNLFYGDQMVNALNTLCANDRAAYIVMDLIEPPQGQAHFHGMVANTKVPEEFTELYPSLSEFGTYEFYLENKHSDEVYINRSEGMLVRTKHAEDHEGGVCAGRGFISSVYVVD